MTTPAADVLAGLRDIHLPHPVSFWPPAPGWWIAAVLGIALLVSGVLIVRAQRRSLRRAALRELSTLEHRFRSSADPGELATELSALLRRVALARYPGDSVAALHGPEWLRFLSGNGGGEFPDEVGEALEMALCMGPAFVPGADEPDRWTSSVRTWIRNNT